MTTASSVPTTRGELEGDEAYDTLRRTGRRRLVVDSLTRFRAADGFSHSRALAFQVTLTLLPALIAVVGFAAALGQDDFTRVVREGQAPEEVPEVEMPAGDPVHLPALLVELFHIPSTSEARRLIAQGGVRLDGAVVSDLDVPRGALEGALLQAGKRQFVRFRPA